MRDTFSFFLYRDGIFKSGNERYTAEFYTTREENFRDLREKIEKEFKVLLSGIVNVSDSEEIKDLVAKVNKHLHYDPEEFHRFFLSD